MAKQIHVLIPEQETTVQTMDDGRYAVGSDPSSHIQIDYLNEIAGRSLTLDVRGEAIFLKNLNTFPIFIGQQELPPGESTEWPPFETLYLSRSVSLQIRGDDANAGDTPSESSQKSRSTMQIAVTLVCLGLCYVMSTGSSEKKQSATKKLDFKLSDLVRQLEQEAPPLTRASTESSPAESESAAENLDVARDLSKLPYERKTILSYLTDAGAADFRWGKTKTDPERAIEAYQLLLAYAPIRDAVSSGDEIEAKIKLFATVRSADLATLVD